MYIPSEVVLTLNISTGEVLTDVFRVISFVIHRVDIWYLLYHYVQVLVVDLEVSM